MMRCGASRGWWRTFHRIASFLFSKSSVMFVHCSRIVHTLKLCCWYEHRVIRRWVRRPTVNDSHYSNLEARWRRIVNKVGKKKLMRCKTLMTTIRWRQQHQRHVQRTTFWWWKRGKLQFLFHCYMIPSRYFSMRWERRQSFVFLLFKLMHTHLYIYFFVHFLGGLCLHTYLFTPFLLCTNTISTLAAPVYVCFIKRSKTFQALQLSDAVSLEELSLKMPLHIRRP